MQVVIALPGLDEIQNKGGVQRSLLRKVSGVPLLARVVATARKSGGSKVLLVYSKDLPQELLDSCLAAVCGSSVPVDTCSLDETFECNNPSAWSAIAEALDSKFLWLPWNAVVDRETLSGLVAEGKASDQGVRFGYAVPRAAGVSERGLAAEIVLSGADAGFPAVVVREHLGIGEGVTAASKPQSTLSLYLASSAVRILPVPRAPGVVVRPSASVREAERELVRRSGKDSDGIYSRFNRWLCRPAVRWLANTPVTPNMVTLSGLVVAILSAYWFAQGYWGGYVVGAVLFFATVLLDEIDGMLARVTFRDSPFGTWLESFVDYASYVLMFSGLTVGLYRQSGPLWLWLGGMLLFGSITSILVVSHQRKLATSPEAPQEYRGRLHRRLEGDSSNIISRLGRHLEFLIRKPAYGHFVFIFVLLGGVKLLFVLTTFGANVVWMMALYFNRFFRAAVPEGHKPSFEGSV